MNEKKWAYINYKKRSVRYSLEKNTFDVLVDGRGYVVRDAMIVAVTDRKGVRKTIADYGKAMIHRAGGEDHASLTVVYNGSQLNQRDLVLSLTINDKGLLIAVRGDSSDIMEIDGILCWGDHDQKENMAVTINRMGEDLRCASGPAVSALDNALFDPYTDSALVFHTAGKYRMRFDWPTDAYRFHFDNGGKDFGCVLMMLVAERVYQTIFNMEYKKTNPDTTFKTPPVGWMTWYSVQFEASERTVLENAEFQRKHLKKYGADAIWVDWEWYHRDLGGVGDSDVDMFHPDPKAYPHGLKYVADKVSEMGFVPALWVGPTCDPTENEMVKKHPDAILVHKPDWCGQYFFDVTHPAFLDEVLPKMLKQAIDWGYKAIKWDCLPKMIDLCDSEHENLYEEGLSTREAMLKAFHKAREIVGKDYYMLHCGVATQRDMDLACAVFDGVRVGADIFRWDDFLSELVDKLYKYYALHNVVVMNDPDNVVIRKKFNTYEQAKTRAAIVSLCGLPFTFGDNLPELSEDRIEILRRSIPPIPNARPMDIRTIKGNRREMKINLAIERPFGRWNVFNAVNLAEEEVEMEINLNGDLHLDVDGSQYFVYDFWSGKPIGQVSDRFSITIGPFASKILSVVKRTDEPQVISTSRHIAHGAIELIDVNWDAEKRILSGMSKVVGGEPYSLVVSCGKDNIGPVAYSNGTSTAEITGIGSGMYRLTYHPEKDGVLNWSAAYVKHVVSD